jgi:AcrR family transcriptional regulator
MMSLAIATPQERILQAATDLFAEVGFRGASTRDIARMAAVNDATVYRHFSSKKDLFAAVLEVELRKLSVQAHLLLHLSNTEGRQSELRIILDLLTQVLAGRPRLLRLLQFSVLEFGTAMQPLYRKYLGELFDVAAEYISSSKQIGPLLTGDPRAMVAAFSVTVVGLQTLYPLFGEQFSNETIRESTDECSILWHALLAGNPLH